MNFMKKINNDIQEQYCSFEVSKLLKEKGLQFGTETVYTHYLKTQKSDNPSFKMKKGELNVDSGFIVNNSSGDYSCEHYYQCERPTHALAIEWVRVNFGIMVWISPHPFSSSGGWSYNMRKYTEGVLRFDIIEDGSSVSLTKQEATEEALLYALKHLI